MFDWRKLCQQPLEIEKVETGRDKKNKLLLDSLEIKGYRCFEHLTIEKLGRVNFVGKNNVGKTALLEALWIYGKRGIISTLVELLFSRDEVPVYVERNSSSTIGDLKFHYTSFTILDFPGFPILTTESVLFRILKPKLL